MQRNVLHSIVIAALVSGTGAEASARAAGSGDGPVKDSRLPLLQGTKPLAGISLDDRIRQRAQAARRLAIRYLARWSDLNPVTWKQVREFYAPTVRFHGRFVHLHSLLEEKRRFAQRWPIRDYSPVLKTMSVGCRADAEECRVETYFTYRAQHPRAGRSAKGLGSLELLIDFASGRPLIISESSRVLRQN
jgi:hypothetical protein